MVGAAEQVADGDLPHRVDRGDAEEVGGGVAGDGEDVAFVAEDELDGGEVAGEELVGAPIPSNQEAGSENRRRGAESASLGFAASPTFFHHKGGGVTR